MLSAPDWLGVVDTVTPPCHPTRMYFLSLAVRSASHPLHWCTCSDSRARLRGLVVRSASPVQEIRRSAPGRACRQAADRLTHTHISVYDCHTRALVRAHTHTRARTHAQTRARARTHKLARAHARTQARTDIGCQVPSEKANLQGFTPDVAPTNTKV